MTLIRPEAVPATLLILTIPMVAIIALREPNSINVRGFLSITTGRIPGALAGVLILIAGPASPFAGFLGHVGQCWNRAASIVRAGFSAPKSGKKFVS